MWSVLFYRRPDSRVFHFLQFDLSSEFELTQGHSYFIFRLQQSLRNFHQMDLYRVAHEFPHEYCTRIIVKKQKQFRITTAAEKRKQYDFQSNENKNDWMVWCAASRSIWCKRRKRILFTFHIKFHPIFSVRFPFECMKKIISTAREALRSLCLSTSAWASVYFGGLFSSYFSSP